MQQRLEPQPDDKRGQYGYSEEQPEKGCTYEKGIVGLLSGRVDSEDHSSLAVTDTEKKSTRALAN